MVRLGRERVQNGDDLSAGAVMLIGVEDHGGVAQGPQITRYLSAGPAAQLGLGSRWLSPPVTTFQG
jgi:hypothetical protein